MDALRSFFDGFYAIVERVVVEGFELGLDDAEPSFASCLYSSTGMHLLYLLSGLGKVSFKAMKAL